ncbi:hypothetical protein ASE03_12750 [Kitasatospora sp. Root187]|nr:hypothetical protein ASC99_20430 [Kitasatospora sp. Root107]KRB60470.1 hypothetical protein ASE03_12750 [Kitasatospora sp. Root187]
MAVLERGRLSDIGRGPQVAGVEDAFTELTGARHALSFNSGTASLHAALHGVGVGPDAGVVVSPMTWISAITAVFQAGSYPVFADIEPSSPNLAASGLAHLPGGCSAVLATHAWGIPARMDDLATATALPIVEDCSHAHGAVYRGRPVGSWGAAGCFSLQESKSVSGGEGGVMTTSDRQVYERALTLGHHPQRLHSELTLASLMPLAATGGGYKYRMPVLSAAIATEQLRTLPVRMKAAEANLATLREVLTSFDAPVTWPRVEDTSVRGWYGTPLIVTEHVHDPQALRGHLKAGAVPVRALYEDWAQTPLLQQPGLAARYWPHLAHTPYTPPTRDSLENYYRAHRQMLVLKIPHVQAPDYMEQVATTMAVALHRTLSSS